MKPYQHVPIQDCGEELEPIPADVFALVQPHFYEGLGAPYGSQSPYWLRRGVLRALRQAQEKLSAAHPGWQIRVFDAFRPVAVQQFMVDYTLQTLLQSHGLAADQITDSQRQEFLAQVYQFWAAPSLDDATPPPHSTGAAIDVTLVNEQGKEVDMGSPIDEISVRSHPDHFASSVDPQARQWHSHRGLLYQVMRSAEFHQHPNEWWHFSLGDQLWAWTVGRETGVEPIARYGRVD